MTDINSSFVDDNYFKSNRLTEYKAKHLKEMYDLLHYCLNM
jgi:hypothetical protein